MKVTDHLAQADHPLISFEIIPPLRGGDVKGLLALIDDLVKYHPPFIDITSHAAEVIYDETAAGIQRRVKRKRPGTLGVCALIQNKYHIDAVPHILCQGFTREETEDFLIELRYLGIDNVLAVRGDESGFQKPLQYGRSANRYACDLVGQIDAMNHGRYLEQDLLDAEPTAFCVGVGGYPEKHFEAPNLPLDVRLLKEKVQAGAHYVVTQMFFDNRHYFHYLDALPRARHRSPHHPGPQDPDLRQAALQHPPHLLRRDPRRALRRSPRRQARARRRHRRRMGLQAIPGAARPGRPLPALLRHAELGRAQEAHGAAEAVGAFVAGALGVRLQWPQEVAMATVSTRILKDQLSSYLQRAEAGEQIVVLRDGQPVAALVPLFQLRELDEQGRLAEMAARGLVALPSGNTPRTLFQDPTLPNRGKLASEMILDDRG